MKLPLHSRILAALALVAFAGCTIILLKLALSNLFLLVVVVATVAVLAYASWLVFTGRHQRLQYGWAVLSICLVLLVVEFDLLLSRTKGRGLLLAAFLLGVVYLFLVRILRREYWVRRREIGRSQAHEFSHPVLIINPKSGNGRAIKAGVDTEARARGIEVVITQKGDDIEALARHAARQGADVLGVSGGDGTLGAVAKVALERDLPLVVLPGGTRCHFARDIGLTPARITDALESFWGVEREADVGSINGRVFVNNVSLGVYADIVDHPEYRRHKVATSRKVLQELLSGTRHAYSLAFADSAGKRHARAVLVLVGVNEYQALKLFELGRRETLDAGVLQVTVITNLDDATVRQLMTLTAFGEQAGGTLPRNFLQWTTPEFTVHSVRKRLVVGVDGEREEYISPVRITLRSQKLRLMVPSEGVRSRPQHVAGRGILKALLWGVRGKNLPT